MSRAKCASTLGRSDQVIPLTFAPDKFTESLVTAGGPETVRVLAVPSDQADRVWFVDAGGQTQIACWAELRR